MRLERQKTSGNWLVLASARTDQDGRCSQLLAGRKSSSRLVLYRLAFDTGTVISRQQKIDGLYPVVEVTFQVRDGESHFHIPLLLSPNGYTTYRGS